MEPNWTLNPETLTVDTFAVDSALETPTRSETGCVSPCPQEPIWP